MADSFSSMEDLFAAHRAGNGESIPISEDEFRRLEAKQHHQRLLRALERFSGGEHGWEALKHMMSHEELPQLLSYIWDRLPDAELVKALGETWVMSDAPEKHLPRRQWLPIFRKVGFHDGGQRVAPPERIQLWRGGVRRTGMSWTADRERAEWFQHRWDVLQPGKLWTITVGPDRLLARYHDDHRREDEYVIDSTGIRPKQV